MNQITLIEPRMFKGKFEEGLSINLPIELFHFNNKGIYNFYYLEGDTKGSFAHPEVPQKNVNVGSIIKREKTDGNELLFFIASSVEGDRGVLSGELEVLGSEEFLNEKIIREFKGDVDDLFKIINEISGLNTAVNYSCDYAMKMLCEKYSF